MTLKVYAVYDTVSKSWNAPFVAPNAAAALRGFADAANDTNTYVGKHPQDYILFEVGTWEDQTGLIGCTNPPDRIGIGSEYVRVSNGAELVTH